MRRLFLGAAALLPFFTGCVSDIDDPIGEKLSPIVNGRTGTADDLESTVGILPTGPGGLCTGTLVAPRVVLTAAHCLCAYGDPSCSGGIATPSSLEVVVGQLNLLAAPPSSRVNVTQVIQHGGFPPGNNQEENHDDIGLLVLDRDVTEVPFMPLAAAVAFDAHLSPQSLVTVSGFGANDGENPRTGGTGVLHTADIPFESRGDREFFAGARSGAGTDASTCIGDSGGPVYATLGGTRAVAGVTSRGRMGSMFFCGDGAVYTWVPAYLDWIMDNIPSGITPPGTLTDPIEPTNPLDPTTPMMGTGGTTMGTSGSDPSSPSTTDPETPPGVGGSQPAPVGGGGGDRQGGSDEAGSTSPGGCSISSSGPSPRNGFWGALFLGCALLRRQRAAAASIS